MCTSLYVVFFLHWSCPSTGMVVQVADEAVVLHPRRPMFMSGKQLKGIRNAGNTADVPAKSGDATEEQIINDVDYRLVSYIGEGDCGPVGASVHTSWCALEDNVAPACQEHVRVNTSICARGVASLVMTFGGGDFDDPVVIDKCSYAYFAVYACMSQIGKTEWDTDLVKIMRHVIQVTRHVHSRIIELSIVHFFESALFFEWATCVVGIVFCTWLHFHMMDWQRKYLALIVWFGMGFSYNMIVWGRLGSPAALMWNTGFYLEVVFSIENIFVFHSVAKMLEAPKKHLQKALSLVIAFQVLMALVFYMGFAGMLVHMSALPYLLGFWLIYVGFQSLRQIGEETHVSDMTFYRLFKDFLGARLSDHWNEDLSIFSERDGKMCCSLLFVLLVLLFLVDFFLQIDVTLTKIEELPNQYICFTSATIAAFALPDLFHVCEGLFNRFFLLHFAVSGVLIFFGAQFLVRRWVTIPDLFSLLIIIIAIGSCILVSYLWDLDGKHHIENPEKNEDATISDKL